MALPLALIAAPVILGLVNSVISSIPPLKRLLDFSLNHRFPNNIPDPLILADLVNKRLLGFDQYHQRMKQWGYNIQETNLYMDYTRQWLGILDYVSLYRRGLITKAELDDQAFKHKMDEVTIDQLLKASEFLPGATDLVRFAVREVYSPEIISDFGLFDEFPQKFADEAKKIGVTEEQAKNYWGAHWILPSLTNGFEMFHRRVIDKQQLDLLMRTQDIMPFWRDKLTQISYNTLTRVDVRRMYSVGVLDEEGVYESYLDFGYSPKNARLMTDFTIRYENDEFSGLTRATVISSYVDDIIDRETLTRYLRGLGYTDSVVDFWLANADYDKTVEQIKQFTDSLTDAYRLGKLSLGDVQNQLLSNDLPATYIDRVVRQLVELKAKDAKLPTKSDVVDWLKKHIINEDDFNRYMLLIGYTPNDIINYLSEIAIDENTEDRRFLSDTVYQRWLKNNIISQQSFERIMQSKGVANEDIIALIAEVEAQKNEVG